MDRGSHQLPQGRGKIEKFFRTVRSQLFPGFKGDILRDINYHDHDYDYVEVLLENRFHGLLRPLNLAVNCRIKRDYRLLRLEASSTTAFTDDSLF
ncbi:hypothetical protein DFAR_2240004 [Desulfarculales bacterium]